jgi:hypothetical protein
MRVLLVVGALSGALACTAQNDSRYAAMALMELPPGARVLGDPGVPAAGPATRVETEACVPGTNGADAAESLKTALSARWDDLRVLPSGERWVVVGQKDGLGVSGTVDAARGACAAGEIYVNLGVHEIPPDSHSRYAGARGPRSAAASRLPVVVPMPAK